MHRAYRLALPCLLLAFSLAGCGKGPSAASLDRNALLPVALEGWMPAKPEEFVTFTLPDADDKGKPNGKTRPARFDVQPQEVVRLAADRAVLITVDQPLNDKNEPQAAHGTPVMLSAFWFKQQNGRWYADGRQDQVGFTGTFATPGTLKVVKLGQDVFGLTAEDSDCLMDGCNQTLTVYTLGHDHVSVALDAAPSGASNTVIDADCDQVVKQAPGVAVQHEEFVRERDQCFAFNGTWHIKPGQDKPGDLQIDFVALQEQRTLIKDLSDDYNERYQFSSTLKRTHPHVVYHFDNGAYHIVGGGQSPVPKT